MAERCVSVGPLASILRRARAIAAALLVLAVVLPGAAAQSVDELAATLSSAERRAGDQHLTLRQREQAVDRALDLRGQLIAAAQENDTRLPGWLLDQAAAVLSRLARDGSDSALLLGLPTAKQLEAATAAAQRAEELLARADGLLERRGIEVENDQDRMVRIPFFRARAQLLLGAAATGEQQRRHASMAHAMVGRISLASAPAEGARRVHLAVALLMRGDDPVDAQVALDELGWVLSKAMEAEQQIPPLTHAEAWMALLHAAAVLNRSEALLERYQEAMRGAPFVRGGSADPLLTVLATDAATRALYRQAVQTSDARVMEKAVEMQARLLERDDLPIGAHALAPLVLEKLAALADEALREAEGMDLPHGLRVAQAVVLSREPEERERAIAILREVCSSPTVCRRFTPDALWELAVLLTQSASVESEGRLEAARALVRLAREFPEARRAGEAIEAALAFARMLDARASEGSLAEARSAVREVYAAALELAVERYPELAEIDIWRYEYGRIALEAVERLDASGGEVGGEAGGEGARKLEGVLRSLEAIDSASSIHAEARVLAKRLHSARLELLWMEFRDIRVRGNASEIAGYARDEIVPAAQQAVAWARGSEAEVLTRFRVELADALLEAGDPEAQRVHETNLRAIEHAAALQHLLPRTQLGLARALLARGAGSRAFGLLRSVAESLEPQVEAAQGAGYPVDDERIGQFWHAWALMAETLAQRGEGAATLGVHVRRLQALDPELGGSPWRERILAALAAAEAE